MPNNTQETNRLKSVMSSAIRSTLLTIAGLLMLTLIAGCATKADYNYVNEAKKYGNKGFAEILNGDGTLAKNNFHRSTQILSSGVKEHALKAHNRAKWQSGFNNAFSVAAQVGLAVAAAKSSTSANQQQSNAIKNSYMQASDQLAQINSMMSNEIRKSQMGIVDSRTRSVDHNVWRAAVISDHPISNSVVRVRTDSGSCTGFFIQPRVVATAAHCFSNLEQPWVEHDNLSSAESFIKGNVMHNPVVSKIRHQLYENSANCNSISIEGKCVTYDIAFLVTKYASTGVSHLPVLSRESKQRNVLFNIGYSGDLNNGFYKRIDYGCSASSEEHYSNALLSYDCASAGGNSGGPVLAVVTKGSGIHAGVVGVHSSAKNDLDARMAGRAFAVYLGMGKDIYRAIVEANPGSGNPALLDNL